MSTDLSPAALLAELRRRGARLTVRRGVLHIYRRRPLPPELRAAIEEHEAELIALLAAERAPASARPVDWTPEERASLEFWRWRHERRAGEGQPT